MTTTVNTTTTIPITHGMTPSIGGFLLLHLMGAGDVTCLQPQVCSFFSLYVYIFVLIITTATSGVDEGRGGGGKRGLRHVMTHLEPQVCFFLLSFYYYCILMILY